jgi:hypothetical protein
MRDLMKDSRPVNSVSSCAINKHRSCARRAARRARRAARRVTELRLPHHVAAAAAAAP